MTRFLQIFLIGLILATFSAISDCARILGLFPTPFRSHLIIHSAIADALVERGHDVTVVATLPKINKNSRFRYVQLEVEELSPSMLASYVNNPPPFYRAYTFFADEIIRYGNDSLHHPAMQKLMKEDSFDLVIQGFYVNHFLLGVAAHFKCPVVMSFMIRPFALVHNLVGNPEEVAYVPGLFLGGKQPMGFLERVKHFLWITLMEDGFAEHLIQSKQLALYNANFPRETYPSYEEMIKNISLVMVNHHFSLGPIRPDVPAMIEIGGVQIKDTPDPLPDDLKSILDNSSQHGVIFFSLGSNMPTDKLDRSRIDIIFKVLSKLPQTILWKWDSENVPGSSPNIIYRKWLPQESILSHPNVKLFLTHGGQGSVVESQYHGVPMVGMPMFGDQPANVANVVQLGFGLSVQFTTLTEDGFRDVMMEALTNKKYANNVGHFSKLFKDRPMTARQTAVFWIEYVLRHRGAPHMQSPAVHMNKIQLMSLDVIAFLIAVVYLVFKVVKVFFVVVKNMVLKKKLKKE